MERENILKLFRHEIPDWLPESSLSMIFPGKALGDLERPHFHDGYDWFGVHWRAQQELGGIITYPDHTQPPVLKKISDWESIDLFPDLNQVDWTYMKEEISADVSAHPDRLVFSMVEHGMFERMTLLMGFENAMIALMDDPSSCKAYAEAFADFKIKVIDQILGVYPYDMLLYQDDLGSMQGPLIAPQTYRDVFKDATHRIGKHIQDCGVIWGYHSCGRMEAFMDDLIECGIELLNPIQTCNDQHRIKQKYGDRLVLYGGLNNQEITDVTNPEEAKIRAEIRRVVDTLAPGGGYILQIRQMAVSTNGVNSVEIQNDEYRRYARDYYQRNR